MLLSGICLALLAVPLAIWNGIVNYNLAKAAVLLVFMPFIVALWGISHRTEAEKQLRLPWILAPLAFLGLIALLSLIRAGNRPEAIQQLLIGALFVQLMVIILHAVRCERDAGVVLGSIVLAGVAAGLIAVLEYAGVLPDCMGRTGAAAMASTFGNKNYLGGFVAYLIIPSSLLVLRSGTTVRRIIAAAIPSFLLVVVFLVDQTALPFSLLAGSLVGAVLTLLVGAKRRRLPRLPLAFFVLLAVISVAIVGFRASQLMYAGGELNEVSQRFAGDTRATHEMLDGNSMPPSASLRQGSCDPRCIAKQTAKRSSIDNQTQQDSGVRSIAELLLRANSIDSRLLFWSIAVRMFMEHPVTGIGLGQYRFLYTPYEAAVRASYEGDPFPTAALRTEVAHNDFLQIAAELGIGGLLGMIGFLAACAWTIWARLAASRESPVQTTWILLLAAGLAVLFTHAMVSFPLHLPSSALAAVVLLALLFCPVTGEQGAFTLSLPGRWLRVLLAGLFLVSAAGAVLAVGEVAGHALMQRGAAELCRGNPRVAQETLERSVGLRFSPRCSVYYLATAQAQLGLYDDALANFERSFGCCAADRVYLFYADLASQLGHLEPARVAIDTLLSTLPPADTRIRAEAVRDQIERLAEMQAAPTDNPDY